METRYSVAKRVGALAYSLLFAVAFVICNVPKLWAVGPIGPPPPPASVPEIDATVGVSAVTLLVCGLLILAARRWRGEKLSVVSDAR